MRYLGGEYRKKWRVHGWGKERATSAGMTLYSYELETKEMLMLSTFHDDVYWEAVVHTLSLRWSGADWVASSRGGLQPAHGGNGKICKNCSVHKSVHTTYQFITSDDPLLWLLHTIHQVVEASVLSHPWHSNSEFTYSVQCVLWCKANPARVLKGSCKGITGGVWGSKSQPPRPRSLASIPWANTQCWSFQL